MELRVNLADREDVAAAHSLLALVLDQTSPVQTVSSPTGTTYAVGVSAVPTSAAPVVPSTAVAAPLPTVPAAVSYTHLTLPTNREV